MDLFKEATKHNYMFPTAKGFVNIQMLWTLPLTVTSKQDVSLDTVAQTIYRELKDTEEVSFVSVNSTASNVLSNKLEIVKAIIADKQAELAARKEEADKKAELQRLTDILADKDDDALKSLNREQILDRINKLKQG